MVVAPAFARDGDLLIGRVVAGRTDDERVFAAVGQQHELVRRLAAHHAGVGFDDQHRQLQPPEDRQIRLDDSFIPGVEVFLGSMEAVGVLHQELAQAHEAPTRTRLVAELALHLVDELRELAIGLGDGAREVAADGVIAPRLLP
jgi:hypothetical protein